MRGTQTWSWWMNWSSSVVLAKSTMKQIALSESTLIAPSRHKYGTICIEGLIHEVYSVGKRFKEANNFLALQKISSMRGYEEKDHPSCRKWRCWQQGAPDQQDYYKDELRYLLWLFFVISSFDNDYFHTENNNNNNNSSALFGLFPEPKLVWEWMPKPRDGNTSTPQRKVGVSVSTPVLDIEPVGDSKSRRWRPSIATGSMIPAGR